MKTISGSLQRKD